MKSSQPKRNKEGGREKEKREEGFRICQRERSHTKVKGQISPPPWT